MNNLFNHKIELYTSSKGTLYKSKTEVIHEKNSF